MLSGNSLGTNISGSARPFLSSTIPEREQILGMEKPPSNTAVVTAAASQELDLSKEPGGELPPTQQNLVTADGSERRIATECEVDSLMHVVDDIPRRTWMVCSLAACERFVWYAATTPLQNYLQNPAGGDVPGALGLGQSKATIIVNVVMISVYLTPIPGAILSDKYGRYKMMVWSAIIEASGASVLFATSMPAALRVGAGLPGVIIGCALLSIGSGAFKVASIPFMAEQYDETSYRIKTLGSGEAAVTSRELTITFIYNAYYWGENVGAMMADFNTFLERYIGFWPAYLVPCCFMWLTTVPLLTLKKKFVNVQPTTATTDTIPHVAAVLWCAFQDGFKLEAAKPEAQLLRHNRVVPWTETLVDEIKESLIICRIFLFCPILWLCFNQTFNNLIAQGGQMVTYGIPNDAIKIAGAITNIIATPVVQNGLYPFLARRRIYFGPIARMTVGFGLLSASMIWAAGLQKGIYSTGPCYDHPGACLAGINTPNQISVFHQIPIYALGEMSLIFFCTTGTEYAYNKAPQCMKSVLQAVWFAMTAIGSCLALAFTGLAYDPRQVIMYSILAALSGASTVLFWVVFRHLNGGKDIKTGTSN